MDILQQKQQIPDKYVEKRVSWLSWSGRYSSTKVWYKNAEQMFH